ncbi:protein tyrosine phosphatase [Brevibacillus borstelensis]|uniref:tyrosine-protein phosphatase n=1 Tax=Brevibacillus borstelensis TaxID=45462 RepID=UPI00148F6345|nr:tyrosine-protein phosphatase [Brevibacillus borstelensis]MCC0563396.1 tyrosine-protein phosphatase [Brevibacillus borstelensis]MCM3558666.1 tyrosine-protein phosphatase [Brevibacillus borstelensis]MCM3591465.1 tyrosine-protein phosphatase [Brevibacillus borstelensis]MED1851785.1 tyrosine-protein phosphatase [Brevibacillus borstelensis]NOU55766.1 protein tyrosine phosphatase [Brevibacillus borstelensis]
MTPAQQSNTYREGANKIAVDMFKDALDPYSMEIFQGLLDVRKEYLQTALDEIKKSYGSYDEYLEKALGLTKEKRKAMQDLLLEGTPKKPEAAQKK